MSTNLSLVKLCFILSNNCLSCLHFASKKYTFLCFQAVSPHCGETRYDTPRCRFSPRPINKNSCWFHLRLTHTKTQWLNERLFYFHIYKSNSLLHQITPFFFPNCCCDFHKKIVTSQNGESLRGAIEEWEVKQKKIRGLLMMIITKSL